MLVIIYKPSVATPAHFHVAYSRCFLRLFAEARQYKPVFEIGIASAGVSSALAVTAPLSVATFPARKSLTSKPVIAINCSNRKWAVVLSSALSLANATWSQKLWL